jgi:thiamine biosynthesis lipoprotein ApbE
VTVSARADDCARGDAWGAALNVLGVETGLPLAERLNLAAQFVIEKSDGKLEVKESTAWKKREALANPLLSAKP